MSVDRMHGAVLGKAASLPAGPIQSLRGTTYHRVHDAILADIVNGTFAPGARLKIADLCARYGLSPMPIREALQQLQGEGIVVMSPNRGASVRAIDRRFVADIYDVRGALYSIIYRDAIAAADSTLDRAIVEIQERFDRMVEAGDVNGCQAQNLLLHATMEAKCSNREVASLMEKYGNLTSSIRNVFGYNIVRLREISVEHWKIINAVLSRDVQLAISEAQHHVKKALANISQNFGEQA